MSTPSPSATIETEPVDLPARARRASVTVLFVITLLGSVASVAYVLWKYAYFVPPAGTEIAADVVSYDIINAVIEGGGWPATFLLMGAPGYALEAVGVAIFLVLLGRGRRWQFNLVGGVLLGLGGVVFALATVAEVMGWAFAANQGIFDEAQGRQIFDTMIEHAEDVLPFGPIILGSLVAKWIGVLVGLIGVLLNRSAPRWFPIAVFGYILLFVILPTGLIGGTVTRIIGDLLQFGMCAGIAWFGFRAALRRDPWTTTVR